MKSALLFVPLAFSCAAAFALDAAGHVTQLSGQVDVRGGKAAAKPATLNSPIGAHQTINTRNQSRTELQLGGARVTLDAESELEIVQLDARRIKLNLHSGSVFLDVPDTSTASRLELITGASRVLVAEPGQVRVDFVNAPDATAIRVLAGSARFESNGSNFTVVRDTQLAQRGRDYSTTTLNPDEFDQWSQGGRGQIATPAYNNPNNTAYNTTYDTSEPRHNPPVVTQTVIQDEPRVVYREEPRTVVYTNGSYTPAPQVVYVNNPDWIYAPLAIAGWVWLGSHWYWHGGHGGYYHHGFVGPIHHSVGPVRPFHR